MPVVRKREKLVTRDEIAAMLDVRPSTVRQWNFRRTRGDVVERVRRSKLDPFPAPAEHTGQPMWRLGEVVDWATRTNRLPVEPVEVSEVG